MSWDPRLFNAPAHIGPHHANWNHDVEMYRQMMGDRVAQEQDWENVGFGALFDLQYELDMKAAAMIEREG